MTVYKNNRGKWIAHVVWENPDGSELEIKKTSPVQTKPGAERYEREIRSALGNGTYGIVRNENVPTVAMYRDGFLQWYANEGSKPASVKRRTELLDDHVIPLFGNRRLNDFSEKQVQDLKTRLAGRRSKSTYNCAAATINKMLGAGKQEGLFSSEPFKFPYFPRGKSKPKYYRKAELDEMLEAAAGISALALCMVLLGADAGERRGEMLGCDGANANFETGKLEIWEAEYIVDGERNAGTTKGGKMRTVPMTPRLAAALKNRIAEVGYGRLFVNGDGDQMTNYELRWLMGRIQKAAGVAATGDLHILRHTFGSHLALAGVPLNVVQALMGHESIQSTMVYVHLVPEDTGAAMNRMTAYRRQPDGNGNAPNGTAAKNKHD